MGYEIKQSQTAQPLVFLLVSSTDHISGLTGASPTVTLSKNGGTFASPSGAVSEIGNGWYKVAGNATDSGTLGPLILHASSAGADPVDDRYEVVAYDPQAASQGLSLAKGTNITGFNDIAAPTGFASATFPTGTIASTTNITAGTIATVSGSVGSVAGNVSGSVASVTGNVGGSVASVTGNIGGSVASVAGNVGGNVVGSVGSVAAGGITAASIASGAITAAKIATDAIGAAQLASDAVAEIQSGLALASQIPANFTTATFASAGVFATAALANAPTGGSAPTAATVAAAVWDLTTTGHTTAGTFGSAMNAAGSAGDPWSTSLPGSYTSGQAGYVVGHNLDALISSRMATFTYTTPPTAVQVRQEMDSNSTKLANLDAAVSSRSVFAGGAVASVTAPVTVGTVNDKAGYSLATAYDAAKTAAQAGDAMTLTTSQVLGTPRDISAIADNAITLNDALWSAVAEMGGKETIVGTAYTKKTPSTGTVVRVFALDDAAAPTSRT